MGSGFRTFTAGEVLTASNVQNYLMDQSVMVFGGSAARSSAIGTANFEEGMVSYLTDTDKVEAYNGTDWVSVAPTTSQGLTLINTTSFSGAVSHSFGSDASPIFSSSYRMHRIILSNVASTTTDQTISFRFRANTTDFTGANYENQLLSAASTTVSASRTSGQTSANIGIASVSTVNSLIIVEVQNAMQTSGNKHLQSSGTNVVNGVGVQILSRACSIVNNAAYNGFTIFAGTNISGQMSVYGYNE